MNSDSLMVSTINSKWRRLFFGSCLFSTPLVYLVLRRRGSPPVKAGLYGGTWQTRRPLSVRSHQSHSAVTQGDKDAAYKGQTVLAQWWSTWPRQRAGDLWDVSRDQEGQNILLMLPMRWKWRLSILTDRKGRKREKRAASKQILVIIWKCTNVLFGKCLLQKESFWEIFPEL